MVQLIDSYRKDAPQLSHVSRVAFKKGNVFALPNAAYIFQSSSATLGALKLYELSQARNDMSKRGTIMAALKLVSQLEVEGNRVEVTLNTQRQRYQRYQE